jgi:hypothetical protein
MLDGRERATAAFFVVETSVSVLIEAMLSRVNSRFRTKQNALDRRNILDGTALCITGGERAAWLIAKKTSSVMSMAS